MTNLYQERDLANGSRNTMSKVCTLQLGFAVADPNLSLSYETSDPEVATVKEGKITYQGVGECVITVKAAGQRRKPLWPLPALSGAWTAGKCSTPSGRISGSPGRKISRIRERSCTG